MAEKTLEELLKLDLSEATYAPYNITHVPEEKNKIRLLSEVLRGATISDEWRTPSVDTLMKEGQRKPTMLERFGWSAGTSVSDAVYLFLPKLYISAMTNPVGTAVGIASAGVGGGLGVKAGTTVAEKLGMEKLTKWGAGKILTSGTKIAGAGAGAYGMGAALSQLDNANVNPLERAKNTFSEEAQKQRLKELEDLRDSGEITDEEYNDTKETYLKNAKLFNDAIKDFVKDSEEKNEVVNILSGRNYPDAKTANEVISWATDLVRDREMLREFQREQNGMNPNDITYKAGNITGIWATFAASNYLFRAGLTQPRFKTVKGVVVKEPPRFSRAQVAEEAEKFGKGYLFAQSIGDYSTEDIMEYITKTGDTDLMYYEPKTIQGAMAGAYSMLSTMTEYEIGGFEELVSGSFKKVGLKLPAFKVFTKTGTQEAAEEAIQTLEEFGARRIDDTTTETWGEALKKAAVAGGWAFAFGGVLGTAVHRINRGILVKGFMEYGKGKIDKTQAGQLADAMIETVADTMSYRKNAQYQKLRALNAAIYQDEDLPEAEKEDMIDTLTALDYTVLSRLSVEQGKNIADNPIFKGEVNELGYFREGIPESIRGLVEEYLTELRDKKKEQADVIEQLNTARQSQDNAKIKELNEKLDEIESALNTLQSEKYKLKKLGNIKVESIKQIKDALQAATLGQLRLPKNASVSQILRVANALKSLNKTDKKFQATQEQKDKTNAVLQSIVDTLEAEGIEIERVKEADGHGAAYITIKRPGMTSLRIRLGHTAIWDGHPGQININFNVSKSQADILSEIRSALTKKMQNTNQVNVNSGFGAVDLMPTKETKQKKVEYYDPFLRFILSTENMSAEKLSFALAEDWFYQYLTHARSGKASKEFVRSWKAIENALGVDINNPKSIKQASQVFAKAFEAWIIDNKDWAKNISLSDKEKEEMEKAFAKYQAHLRDIYENIADPYFEETWGRVGELKPELKAWFDRVVNITDLDTMVERGEMTESQAANEKLNRAIDTVIENTTDSDTKQALTEAKVLNDTSRYEVEGGNKNSIQQRLSILAKDIDENNMVLKGEKYDTRRDMMQVAEAADNFVKTRLDDALAIINGEMAETEGLYKEDLYTALERLAVENGDLNLIDELKNSEVANRLAKELGQRVAGFRNIKQSTDIDVVSALKSLDMKFNKALDNKKAKQEYDAALKLLDESIKQQDKIADKELDNFLKELECK